MTDECYESVVARIEQKIGDKDKWELGVYDVMKCVGVGYNKARKVYMNGKSKITIFKLAERMFSDKLFS